MKITPTIILAVLWLLFIGWGFQALLRRHLRLDDRLADKESELASERHARGAAERALANAHLSLCKLARQQESVRETERHRIARDIHDDLGQNLLALKVDLSLLHVSTSGAHPHIKQKVDTMIGNIDLTIASLRTIIHDLRPVALEAGFVSAIEFQLNEFTRMHGIRHELRLDPALSNSSADSESETMLYRILQEALSNVVRHAHATDVAVELCRDGDRLALKVKDNGIGIPLAGERHGSGLSGMRERVKAVGGKFAIDSLEGVGTILTLSIPLTQTCVVH
jgi:signal transduction histidine kinase